MSGVSNPKLLLSEGTCYFGAGQKADSHFIPCGNANLEGDLACCYAGDYCLAGNACWDSTSIVTYIAGCTDPLFRASTCPQRNNYPDQQWIALARCNGDEKQYWTGCDHHPELIEIEKENCECNRSNTLIENPDGNIPTLLEIGLLPNKTGERVDFNPTALPSASPTGKDGSGGLSTGAKAGIGVGVTIAALLVIGAAVFFFLRRRKNSKPPAYTEESGIDGPNVMRHESASNEKAELSPEVARMELPSPGEKMTQLSPTYHPSELYNTNQYNGSINRPSAVSSEPRSVSDDDAPSAISRNEGEDTFPGDANHPSFQSPFSDNREVVVSPQESIDSGSSAPRKSQLKGSRAYSVATPAADESRRSAPREARGSVPMAGGFEIGERSRASQRAKRAHLDG